MIPPELMVRIDQYVFAQEEPDPDRKSDMVFAIRVALRDGMVDHDALLGWGIVNTLLTEWLRGLGVTYAEAFAPDMVRWTHNQIDSFVLKATDYVLEQRVGKGTYFLGCVLHLLGLRLPSARRWQEYRDQLSEYAEDHFRDYGRPFAS